MNPMSDKDIAEFINLFQNAQAPKEEAQQEAEDGPYMRSDAADAAKQLGDYLRKLHADDMQSHNANNAWLQQIDKNVKKLEDVVFGAVLASAVVVFLMGLVLGLILKSGG